MIDVRTLLTAAAISGCAALSACAGPYGVKGDKGLPPAPEHMETPNINMVPRKEDGRPLKSASEQDRMKSGLEARQPRSARAPRPFSAKAAIRQQQEQADRAAKRP